MKKKIIIFFFAIVLSLTLACTGISVLAQEFVTNDTKYYEADYDAFIKNNTPVTADANWRSWIKVTEAETGIHIAWRSAVQNVHLQYPEAIKLDGLHAVFNNLVASSSAKIVFELTSANRLGDYIPNSNNHSAQLPFMLAVDLNTGRVWTKTAKIYNKKDDTEIENEILSTSNLTAANLSNKEWSIKFTKTDNGDYEVTIADTKFILPESQIKTPTASMNLDKCYFVLNNMGPDTNSFSLNLLSVHSGACVCADDPSSQPYLKAATELIAKIDNIGTVTYDKGDVISQIRELYDNMPASIRTLITNSARFERDERVYAVVKQIEEFGQISLNSADKLDKLNKSYKELTDEEKLLVSNFEKYNSIKKEYYNLLFTDSLNPKTRIEYVQGEDKIITVPGTPDVIQIKPDTIEETVTTNKTVMRIRYKNEAVTICAIIGGGMLVVLLAGIAVILIKRKKAGVR